MDNHRATRRPDGKPETPADTRFFDLRESGYLGPVDQDGYKTGDWVADTRTGQTYSTYSEHPGLLQSPGEEWPRWRQEMRGRYAAGDRMQCPGCGEPAVHRPPTDLVPWQAHGNERPAWSHANGSALCPVIGPGGYLPATPVPAASGTASSATGPAKPAADLELPSSDAQFLDSCGQLASQLSDLSSQVTDWAEGLAGLHLPRPVLAPLHDVAGLLADATVQAIKAGQAFRTQFGNARQAAARGLRITGDSS